MSLRNLILQYAPMAFNILLKPSHAIDMPKHIQVEVTTFCNMNCLSCGRRNIIDKSHHMRFADLKKIFDAIKPYNINLSGLGEPLLNPDIYRMITDCKAKGAVVNFPTNLNVSANHIIKLLEAGPQQIKVSIDTTTPETYQFVRRANTFHKVKNNICLINKRKQEHHLRHPEIRFNFALQKANLYELPTLFSLASELGVNSVYIQDLNYFSVEKEKASLCDIDRNSLKTVLIKSAQIARKYKIVTNLNNWKRNFESYYNKMLPKDEFQPHPLKCLFPWVSAFIDVYGNVKPCPVFVWEKDSYSLGNCLEKPFAQIWNGPKYRHLRRTFKRNQRVYDICKRCVPPDMFDMRIVFQKMLLRG